MTQKIALLEFMLKIFHVPTPEKKKKNFFVAPPPLLDGIFICTLISTPTTILDDSLSSDFVVRDVIQN